MIRLILSLVFLLFFACPPAQAQEHVAARIGAHTGYSRLVFEWLSPVAYHVNREGGALTVTFARAGSFDAVPVDANIASVTTVSTAGQPLSVKILSAPSARFSDFSAGNRVIVDVYGGAAAQAKPPAPVPAAKQAPPKAPGKPKMTEKKPEPEKKAEPVKTAELAKKPEPGKKPEPEKKTAEKIVPPSKMPAPAAKPAKVEPVEQAAVEEAKPKIEANVITVSITEQAGMAAFVRNGNLWIVLDRPDIAIAPIVTGPRPDIVGAFRRVEFTGGVAFVTKLPADPGLEIYGAGGGLVWKLTITAEARDAAPAAMQRNFAPDRSSAGITVFWAMPGATRVLDVPDADVGDKIKVVTVNTAAQFAGPQQETVDFTALRSIVGLAIAPKADNLSLNRTSLGIKISRPQGLSLSPRKDLSLRQMQHDVVAPSMGQKDSSPQAMRRIFDFEKWQMGGLKQVEENQRILKAGMAGKDRDGQVQDLLTIAKMNLANDRGQEAIGFLTYAAAELPAIADAPEFKALRGAAEALSGKYELALEDLNAPELKPYTELDFWRAYTLGWLGDWQQARASAPADAGIVLAYPKELLAKMGVKLAEIALRAGDVKTAERILGVLEKDRRIFPPGTVAGMDYLEGEAHRQKGEPDKAKTLWTPLTTGKDHLYRAKAGLALAMLQLQKGDITRAQALDRLEGLRYVWRGDELESRINFMLGKLYLEDRQYLKGFNILRDAAGMSPEGDIAGEISSFMREQFKTLLMEDKTITPLDSALVYEEFPELAPGGADGDALAQRLAEHLVEADLLPRAAALLQKQVDTRLHGADQARVASRLAAIYLLDRQPQKAIAALDAAQNFYGKQTDKESVMAQRRVDLMRARAMSQLGRASDALAMLAKFPNDPDVNTLRANIAWDSGLWDQAAVALQDMILDQGADEGKPLTQKQADLILNRAVALNLSGNKVALANLHSRYRDAMGKTSRAKLFDVVARPRESALLSDQQTLEAIVSEVDIFKDFLESYRSADVSQ